MKKNGKSRKILFLIILFLLLVLAGIWKRQSEVQGEGDVNPFILMPLKLTG